MPVHFPLSVMKPPGWIQVPKVMKGGVARGLTGAPEPPRRMQISQITMPPYWLLIIQHSCQSCIWRELAVVNQDRCHRVKISSEIRRAGLGGCRKTVRITEHFCDNRYCRWMGDISERRRPETAGKCQFFDLKLCNHLSYSFSWQNMISEVKKDRT